jgi:hypothetical protein
MQGILVMKNAMVVRIRFGLGPLVTRRKGKNGRIALLSASVLTLTSICFASLGFWRLSEDVDLSNDFVYRDGLLSHWQVWIAAAVLSQYGAWRLTQYARSGQQQAESPALNVLSAEAPAIAAEPIAQSHTVGV